MAIAVSPPAVLPPRRQGGGLAAGRHLCAVPARRAPTSAATARLGPRRWWRPPSNWPARATSWPGHDAADPAPVGAHGGIETRRGMGHRMASRRAPSSSTITGARRARSSWPPASWWRRVSWLGLRAVLPFGPHDRDGRVHQLRRSPRPRHRQPGDDPRHQRARLRTAANFDDLLPDRPKVSWKPGPRPLPVRAGGAVSVRRRPGRAGPASHPARRSPRARGSGRRRWARRRHPARRTATAEGALPGAVVVERNVLEWRLDPAL